MENILVFGITFNIYTLIRLWRLFVGLLLNKVFVAVDFLSIVFICLFWHLFNFHLSWYYAGFWPIVFGFCLYLCVIFSLNCPISLCFVVSVDFSSECWTNAWYTHIFKQLFFLFLAVNFYVNCGLFSATKIWFSYRLSINCDGAAVFSLILLIDSVCRSNACDSCVA